MLYANCRTEDFPSLACYPQKNLRVQWDGLFDLAVSLTQTARMATSSPEPFGTASLLLLAKYQRVSLEVAVRLPGI
jgi:hypothetical protein